MNSPNLGTNWSPGEHPPLELLRQYQAGALSPEADFQVERHLLSCELCADVAEGMVLSSPAQTQAAVTDLQRRVKQRLAKKEKKAAPLVWLDWRAAAAVLVLFCCLGLVIYQQYRQQSVTKQTVASAPAPPVVKPEASRLPSAEPNPPVVQDESTLEESFIPSTPPIARHDTRRRMKYAPPVLKRDEEVAFADAGTGTTDSTATSFTAPEPTMASTKLLVDTSLAPERIAVQNEFRAADEEKPLFNKAKDTPATRIAIRGMAPLTRSVTAISSGKKVVGKVVSTDGEAMPGVTVQVKGTSQTVSTDANGRFQVATPDSNAVLVFNFIGYQPQETRLQGQNKPLEVQLQPDYSALNEVVVIGYGTTTNGPVQPDQTTTPKPAKGISAFKKYIKENQRLSPNAPKGRVVVQFTVSENGSIVNPQVVKGLSPAADAEAIRLLKEGPVWKPGTRNNHPAAQQVNISVRFR